MCFEIRFESKGCAQWSNFQKDMFRTTRYSSSFVLVISLSFGMISCSERDKEPAGFEQTELADIPDGANKIRSEVVVDGATQYFFLTFCADKKSIDSWLKANHKLKSASVETVFEENLLIHPGKVPGWFEVTSSKVDASGREMYYHLTENQWLFTLLIVDRKNKRVLIESRQKAKSTTAHNKTYMK